MAPTTAVAFLVLMSCLMFVLPPGECRKCTIGKAEEGANICEDALKKTATENRKKFVTSPKQAACCLTNGLSECVEFAFKSAKCSEKTTLIKEIISDKLHHAQSAMTSVARFISLKLCGDYDKSKCSGLNTHYDSAMKRIALINGSDWLQASSVLTMVLVLLAYLSA